MKTQIRILAGDNDLLFQERDHSPVIVREDLRPMDMLTAIVADLVRELCNDENKPITLSYVNVGQVPTSYLASEWFQFEYQP